MWKMCNIRTCVYAISVQRTKDNNKKSNMCSRLSVSFNSYYHNQVAATAACRSMRIDGLTRVQNVQCVNKTLLRVVDILLPLSIKLSIRSRQPKLLSIEIPPRYNKKSVTARH